MSFRRVHHGIGWRGRRLDWLISFLAFHRDWRIIKTGSTRPNGQRAHGVHVNFGSSLFAAHFDPVGLHDKYHT